MFRTATHQFKESDIRDNCDIVILSREEKINIPNGGILLEGELSEIRKNEKGEEKIGDIKLETEKA